jgi:hypothetical protein
MIPPASPLSTLRYDPSRDHRQDSRPEWSRFSFSVGLSHPLQCAGLSRRSPSPKKAPNTGETEADRDRATLFSLNPVTLKQNVIKELGRNFKPDTTFVLSIRFSTSPDGKSFLYSTGKYRSDLWMLEGYRQPG